jgi:hypothetical protein
MRRLDSLFRVLAIVLLTAALAGSASAGYWQVEYDLAPGSTLMTKDPFGTTDIDPIQGKLWVRYDAASQAAPLTGARLVGGYTHITIQQPNTPPGMFFEIQGITDMKLLPQDCGTGTLTGATLIPPVVADSKQTGYLHCVEGAGQGGNCLLAGMVHTVPFPQTPTVTPWPQSFPKFIFATTAGVGDFTSTVKTQTVQTGLFTVTLYSTYVGREVSRVWKQSVPSISSRGLAGLGLWVLAVGVGGTLWMQRRRGAAKTE